MEFIVPHKAKDKEDNLFHTLDNAIAQATKASLHSLEEEWKAALFSKHKKAMAEVPPPHRAPCNPPLQPLGPAHQFPTQHIAALHFPMIKLGGGSSGAFLQPPPVLTFALPHLVPHMSSVF